MRAKAHVKQKKGYCKTMEQEHNDMVDTLAKRSLQVGLQTGRYAASEMHLKDTWFNQDGRRITGGMGRNLREYWA